MSRDASGLWLLLGGASSATTRYRALRVAHMLAQHAAVGTALPELWSFASRPIHQLLDPVTWQPGPLGEQAL
eukprot:1099202-Lingulodinium_polyedra.AAC.1